MASRMLAGKGMNEQSNKNLNGYKAFYNGRTLDVYAETSFKAQEQAAKLFKAKKAHQVTVILCERADGSQVEYSPN